MQGKGFKASINSGTAISLMHTSVYSMKEDHYITSILPAAVHPRIANGSPNLSMGKATLHLQIVNFKFSYTFIICNRQRETFFLTSISRKGIPYLIVRTWTDTSSYREKAHSCPTLETGKNLIILNGKIYIKNPIQTQWCHTCTDQRHDLRHQVAYFIGN